MEKRTKECTVSELQTFIEAVEFAADQENWVPSERQWRRIREMINNLVETRPDQPMQWSAPAAMPMSAPMLPPQPMQVPMTMGPQALPPIPMQAPGMPQPSENGPYQSPFAA